MKSDIKQFPVSTYAWFQRQFSASQSEVSRLNPTRALVPDISIEVPVIRNAGGRVKESLLSTAVLDTITVVGEILVLHHTSEQDTPNRYV